MNFLLRTLKNKGSWLDNMLGSYYEYSSKEHDKEEFDKVTEQWSEEDLKEVYAVVVFNDGEDIIPLYQSNTYYVMATDGNTVANISQKPN